MANAPGVNDKSDKSAKPAKPAKAGLPKQPLVDERFWKRYSPHGELPLSGAGSFALHALIVGFLVLWAVYLAAYFSKPSRNLPVESVRLDLGGGGGSRSGEGDNKGIGHGAEAVANGQENPQQGNKEEAPARPDLTPAEVKDLSLKFDNETVRVIQKGPDSMKAFARLNDSVRRKLSDGLNPGQGRGGSGSGGGRGSGTGTGEGAGRGEGKLNLNKREKRMLRWSMSFNTRTGDDYIRQLRGLGAILAVPVKEGNPPEYKIIRDLSKRPAQLLDEDLSQIKRIYWIDDKPRSVMEVMNVLQIRLRPSHFVAFMTIDLEQKLFELERDYKGLAEDRIHETRFRIVESAGTYRPEVMDQTPK
ncbi:MAG TPA: hypothetical protein VFE78_12970 [Gemmataceae bacterium]|jgi:hypothetical protein|nr:hypothetical protein [Gemmataceae bacterium]